jgi:hypothetical protein
MTRAFLVIALLSASLPSRTHAQAPEESVPPAHLAIVEGSGSLIRDGRAEELAGGVALVEGDMVRTDDGRLAIVLREGSALYVDSGTEVDVQSSSHFRLFAGQATLLVIDSPETGPTSYRIDTSATSLSVEGPGEYRVLVFSDPATGVATTEVAVVRGLVRLGVISDGLTVRTGERAVIREGDAPAVPQPFNSARLTDFDRWVRDRQGAQTASRSAEYLPPEIDAYSSAFDRYGTWGDMPGYGAVWYPTAVGIDWRPYYNGHWNNVGRYGWLWVDADPWGWPTHHFGHWGFDRGSWFWKPGAIWGRPRVWWGVSSGHIAWCPIGLDGRPLFGFWGHGRTGHFDAWRGWTAVGRGSFATRAHVGSAAVDIRTLDRDPQAAFVFQRGAPASRPPVARGTWMSNGQVGRLPPGPGAAFRGGSAAIGLGLPGIGLGSGAAGGTRIDSPPRGMMPAYPYGPAPQAESPYSRAERVAAERRANPARARPAMPGSRVAPGGMPLPPSQPAVAPPNRPAQPRSNGSPQGSREMSGPRVSSRSSTGPVPSRSPRAGMVVGAPVPVTPLASTPSPRTASPRGRP